VDNLVDANAMLQQEANAEGSIPRVYVGGGPHLRRSDEDFSRLAVIKSADSQRVALAVMLHIDDFMCPAIGEGAAGHGRSEFLGQKVRKGVPARGRVFLPSLFFVLAILTSPHTPKGVVVG
jgi:hypothetical protein